MVFIFTYYSFKPLLKIFLGLILGVFYLMFHIFPKKSRTSRTRLNLMISGRELILTSTFCLIAEALFYCYIYFISSWKPLISISVINGLVSLLLLFALMLNGFLRILCTSSQLGIVWRVLVIFFWWVPLINLFLFWKVCNIVKREIRFELAKLDLYDIRKERAVCQTKYPILLVHGIFFRDWQFINYWGRIPKELMKNGATVFYGNQQSAAAIATSAAELKEQILKIISTTNCGKVNIIAHSKGGLDARYAISCLGMDQYVASLTTVNTPHRGCNFVDRILCKLPDSFVLFVAKKYNAAFKKLGDRNPDFYEGIYDLTAERCSKFNQTVPNQPGVLYQSITSKMRNSFSAGFPLNLGHAIIKRIDGDNDGLVAVFSSLWDNSFPVLTANGKRGISHGDVIDLTRKNLPGYDVCEYYVNLVKGLKERQL